MVRLCINPVTINFYFVGICSSMGELNAHVVMSGDPMQLGPVLQSKTAETLGLGM